MKILVTILFALYAVFPVQGQEVPQGLQDVNEDDLGLVTDEFQEYFFEALKQKGIENYEKAITALEKCRDLAPEKGVVYFELGKNYRELKKFELALSNFQKAHELQPEKESVLLALFQTHGILEDYPGAISAVKKLIPFDPRYREDLANLYLLNKEYDRSLALLDELDAEQGNSSYRTSLRRQIYARTNNVEAQIENLQKSISRDPEVEQNYLNLIFMYSEQGDQEEAFRVARELLDAIPGSALAHLALYKFYLDRDDAESALSSMRTVFQSEEIDTESKFKVLNDFLNFVEDNPVYEPELIAVSAQLKEWDKAPKLYEQLGTYYLSKGKKDEALTFFELGLEEEPANLDLIMNTIGLQLEFGKFGQVVQVSTEALESFPSQPVLYLARGVAYNEQQNYKAAEESLLTGLDYLIENLEMEHDFYSQLSKTYNGMNNAEKAKEYRLKAENLKKEIN